MEHDYSRAADSRGSPEASSHSIAYCTFVTGFNFFRLHMASNSGRSWSCCCSSSKSTRSHSYSSLACRCFQNSRNSVTTVERSIRVEPSIDGQAKVCLTNKSCKAATLGAGGAPYSGVDLLLEQRIWVPYPASILGGHNHLYSKSRRSNDIFPHWAPDVHIWRAHARDGGTYNWNQ